MERTVNMAKPLIYKAPGQERYVCSMFITGKRVHGFGATMRAAYQDWCLQVYGATIPKLE